MAGAHFPPKRCRSIGEITASPATSRGPVKIIIQRAWSRQIRHRSSKEAAWARRGSEILELTWTKAWEST